MPAALQTLGLQISIPFTGATLQSLTFKSKTYEQLKLLQQKVYDFCSGNVIRHVGVQRHDLHMFKFFKIQTSILYGQTVLMQIPHIFGVAFAEGLY